MGNVPLSWRLSVSGASDVRTRLNEVRQAFEAGKLSVEDYGKETRAISRDISTLTRVQNLNNRIFLATHPNIMKLSKAMSTFGSVARTALSITNALNLARIASSGLANQQREKEYELAAAIREYNEAVADGDPDKIQTAAEKVAVLKDELETLSEEIKNQDFQDFITKVEAAVLTISTVFNVLLKSETIRNAIFKGAAFLGTLFGGVFSGFSTLVIKAGTWLWNALFAPSVASKSALGGATHGGLFAGAFTFISNAIMKAGAWLRALLHPHSFAKTSIGGGAHGTLFGGTFAVAAETALIIALPLVIAGALDAILESLTGYSFVRSITEAIFGEGEGFSVKDMLGIPQEGLSIMDTLFGGKGLSASELFDESERLDKFKGKPFGIDLKINPIIEDGGLGSGLFSGLFSGEQKDISENVDFSKFLTMFDSQMPEAYAANETAFGDSWLTNIPETFAEASVTIQNQSKGLWNALIGGANAAGSAITDGLNTIFSQLFEHMNNLIAAYNRAAEKLDKPTIAPITFTPASFEDIPTIAAARGFSGVVSRPTMFLAGEAGAETVNITPNGRGNGGGSGGSQTVVINVQGSVISEKQLMKIFDNHQKNNLKRRGFTGI